MNIEQLRTKLIKSYELYKKGKISLKNIKAETQLFHKILISAALELHYKQLTNNNQPVIFLETKKVIDIPYKDVTNENSI